MLTTEVLGETMHHHYATDVRKKEANCWDTGHVQEKLLGAAQPERQAQLLPRAVCLTVTSLELHFLLRFVLRISLGMVSLFAG